MKTFLRSFIMICCVSLSVASIANAQPIPLQDASMNESIARIDDLIERNRQSIRNCDLLLERFEKKYGPIKKHMSENPQMRKLKTKLANHPQKRRS